MKQNKLLTLSLLASFLLLISASYSTAANTVTYGTIDVCPQHAGAKVYVPVSVGNDVDLAALDLVGQIVTLSGGVNLKVTGVAFNNRMVLTNVLDQRYPIGDLGGGFFRFGAVKTTGADLVAGTGQIATLELEFVSDCKLGSAGLDPATANCDGHDVSTQFVDKDANAINPNPITSGAVNVVNTPPHFTNCPTKPDTVYWGGSVVHALTADDPDLTCGCDALTYSLVSPSPGQVTGNVYQLVAGAATIGCNTVVVKVADSFGGEATCTFNIVVLDKPPVITCPGNAIILMGQTYTGTVTAVDPDHGPSSLVYTLVSFDGPGTLTLDPVSGAISWPTLNQAAYIGTFNVCVKVSDGAKIDACNTVNSDQCCFTIKVLPKFRVTILKDEGLDGKGVLQGHYTDVPIYIDASWTTMNMGGFDFLISYDVTVLTLSSVDPGALLTTCGWEYFTYRFGANGNCGGVCPSGLVRIVAMAETNNGPYHPTCFNNASGSQLAVMHFLVNNNRTMDCQFAPISFYWLDCGDNTISSKYGDTLFLADKVYFFDGTATPAFTGYPSNYGTSSDCLFGDKVKPLRAIDFRHGGVDVICSDSIDARGDVNANGVPNEIADAVMFTNYFISGLSAFGTHVESSIAASDVNADGTVLSVADLVYLIRVIQGDASPYAKVKSGVDNFTVKTQLMNNTLTLSYNSTVNAGAALFVFHVNGTVGAPVVLNGMDVNYGLSGNELRVLVYNIGEKSIASGEGVLLTIPVTGTMDLVSVDAADFYGNTMNVSVRALPTMFDLSQNYPNPFNPSTTIKLALPVASEYSLAIYNVAGQLIRSYNGSAAAGVVEVVWDGKDASGNQVASGMYFYKASASNFSATKKMILMK
jgi:hypothetical protein